MPGSTAPARAREATGAGTCHRPQGDETLAVLSLPVAAQSIGAVLQDATAPAGGTVANCGERIYLTTFRLGRLPLAELPPLVDGEALREVLSPLGGGGS